MFSVKTINGMTSNNISHITLLNFVVNKSDMDILVQY